MQQNQARSVEARVGADAVVGVAVVSVEMEKCKHCVGVLIANTLAGESGHGLEVAESS